MMICGFHLILSYLVEAGIIFEKELKPIICNDIALLFILFLYIFAANLSRAKI